MLVEIVLLILGAFAVFVIDILWWNIDFKKAEKGFEAHEHYHVGLELLIGAMFLSFINEILVYFLLGAGFAFIMAEWRQTVEIRETKDGKEEKKSVIPGHPFAYGSPHFAKSTAIGIALTSFLAGLIVIKIA